MTGLIHISAPVPWIEKLTMFSRIKGISRSELIRRAVDNYLHDFKPPIGQEEIRNG